MYLCFGTHQVVLPDCVGLETKVDLYLDNVKIELPELQAIVCINIDSWGAGVHLWGEYTNIVKKIPKKHPLNIRIIFFDDSRNER